MNKHPATLSYERKVTGAERFFSHAPFSTVTIVARIKGKVTEEMLRNAVKKVQQRHALLRVRIRDAQNGELWFTSDGAQEIPVEIFAVVADLEFLDWVGHRSHQYRNLHSPSRVGR